MVRWEALLPCDRGRDLEDRSRAGPRVWLYDVIVESVDQDQVVVSQQRGPICDQGTCDFYLVGTSVPWKGTPRPVVGTTITLFGTTTQGGLVPAGYTVFGFCDDLYRMPC